MPKLVTNVHWTQPQPLNNTQVPAFKVLAEQVNQAAFADLSAQGKVLSVLAGWKDAREAGFDAELEFRVNPVNQHHAMTFAHVACIGLRERATLRVSSEYESGHIAMRMQLIRVAPDGTRLLPNRDLNPDLDLDPNPNPSHSTAGKVGIIEESFFFDYPVIYEDYYLDKIVSTSPWLGTVLALGNALAYIRRYDEQIKVPATPFGFTRRVIYAMLPPALRELYAIPAAERKRMEALARKQEKLQRQLAKARLADEMVQYSLQEIRDIFNPTAIPTHEPAIDSDSYPDSDPDLDLDLDDLDSALDSNDAGIAQPQEPSIPDFFTSVVESVESVESINPTDSQERPQAVACNESPNGPTSDISDISDASPSDSIDSPDSIDPDALADVLAVMRNIKRESGDE